MECLVQPFSAAEVCLADDYVENFPSMDDLMFYLQSLCTELGVQIVSEEKPMIMKGPWHIIVQLENFMKSLLSELQQCISNEVNPSVQNLIHAFDHCSNLVTFKKDVHEPFSKSFLPPSSTASFSQSTVSSVHKDESKDHSKNEPHINNDAGEQENSQEIDKHMYLPRNIEKPHDIPQTETVILISVNDAVLRDSVKIKCEKDIYPQKSSELETGQRYGTQSKASSIQKDFILEKSKVQTHLLSSGLEYSRADEKCTAKLKHTNSLPCPTHKDSLITDSFSFNNSDCAPKTVTSDNDTQIESETSPVKESQPKAKLQVSKCSQKNYNRKLRLSKNSKIFSSQSETKVSCEIKKNEHSSCVAKTKFKISNVNKTRKIKKEFNIVVANNDSNISLSCVECSYQAKSSVRLQEHIKRVHRAKQFKCSVCSKEFGFKKDLNRHMKCHKEAEYSCEKCGKTYKEASKLKSHKKTHDSNYIKPKHSCEQCSKSFSSRYTLSYHIQAEHLGMKPSFICPTCGRSFSQKRSYIHHCNIHKGVKPFTCATCNRKYTYIQSLRDHLSVHDDTKTFVCPVCSKLFRQGSNLNVHMRIHKGTKSFICSQCGKAFGQRQALVRHERTHVQAKPFECCLCGRPFGDSSVLRRHMIHVHNMTSTDWQKHTQRHIKSKNASITHVVSDSITSNTETTSETQGKSHDSENKDLSGHGPEQKEIILQTSNTSDC